MKKVNTNTVQQFILYNAISRKRHQNTEGYHGYSSGQTDYTCSPDFTPTRGSQPTATMFGLELSGAVLNILQIMPRVLLPIAQDLLRFCRRSWSSRQPTYFSTLARTEQRS